LLCGNPPLGAHSLKLSWTNHTSIWC